MKYVTYPLRRPARAFTLIELLIVVAIIAILAAIAVPNFLEAQVRAKVSAAKADIRSLVTALESYHIDNNKYISHECLSNDGANWTVWNREGMLHLLTTPIAYMSALPQDTPLGPWGESFYPGKQFRGYKYIGGAWWTSIDWGGRTLRQLYCLDWGFMDPKNMECEYLLYCIGPTHLISIGQVGKFTAYDASNGTVSIGDIMWTGGNHTGDVSSFN